MPINRFERCTQTRTSNAFSLTSFDTFAMRKPKNKVKLNVFNVIDFLTFPFHYLVYWTKCHVCESKSLFVVSSALCMISQHFMIWAVIISTAWKKIDLKTKKEIKIIVLPVKPETNQIKSMLNRIVNHKETWKQKQKINRGKGKTKIKVIKTNNKNNIVLIKYEH